jgi:D-inositol-3-phosphate glycosyltransferase
VSVGPGSTGPPDGVRSVLLCSTGMVDIPPETGGGVEAYVYDIARSLASRGASVSVVSNPRSGWAGNDHVRFVVSGSVVDRFPLGPVASTLAHLLGGSATARAALSDLADGRRPSVIHLNEEVSATLLCRSKLLVGVPKVYTLHNPPPVEGTERFRSADWLFRYLDSIASRRLLWGKVQVIVALSSWIRTYLIDRGLDPKAIVHLPLPIDTSLFHPSVEPEAPTPPYVLYVGRLDARKSVHTLVDAMAASTSRWRAILVGDGPLRESLSAHIRRRGLEARVEILPKVPFDRLLALYRGASVFVLPSTLEAAPRVVLEAAASGVPVVVPDLFVYADLAEQGYALRFVAGDAGSLAQTIDRLAGDEATRRRLGAAGRRFAVERAQFDQFVEGLLGAYRTAIDRVA